jgi:hypothetical protein
MTDKFEIEVEPERIIEIDPNGKYVMILPLHTPDDLLKSTADVVEEWLENDNPILIARGVEIVRVDGEEENETTRSPRRSESGQES